MVEEENRSGSFRQGCAQTTSIEEASIRRRFVGGRGHLSDDKPDALARRKVQQRAVFLSPTPSVMKPKKEFHAESIERIFLFLALLWFV